MPQQNALDDFSLVSPDLLWVLDFLPRVNPQSSRIGKGGGGQRWRGRFEQPRSLAISRPQSRARRLSPAKSPSSFAVLTLSTQCAIFWRMEGFDWDPAKNAWLEKTRGVGFNDAVFHIQNGDVLDIIEHPNPGRYPNQRIFVLEMEGYAYLVPFVEQEGGVFLKTVIPSRKATREYLE